MWWWAEQLGNHNQSNVSTSNSNNYSSSAVSDTTTTNASGVFGGDDAATMLSDGMLSDGTSGRLHDVLLGTTIKDAVNVDKTEREPPFELWHPPPW